MKLRDGMIVKEVKLEVDPIKMSYAQAEAEAEKIRHRFGSDCIIKFNYCGYKVVVGENKNKK